MLLSFLLVAALNNRAHELHLSAKYVEAESTYRFALRMAATDLEQATVENNLGLLLKDMGRSAEARLLVDRALAARRKALPPGSAEIASTLNNSATISVTEGRLTEALTLYREGLEIRRHLPANSLRANPQVADLLINIAMVEKMQGKLKDSLNHYREGLALLTALSDPPARSLIAVHNNLGSILNVLDRPAQSRAHIYEALRISLEAHGDQHPTHALLLEGLAALDIKQKRWKQAAESAAAAHRIVQVHFPATHVRQAAILKLQGSIEYGRDNFEAAEDLLQRAHRILEDSKGPVHIELADVHFLYAKLRLRQKREAAAIEHLEQAIEITNRSMGPAAPSLSGILSLYSSVLRRRERFAEAAKAEQQLQTIFTKTALAREMVSARN